MGLHLPYAFLSQECRCARQYNSTGQGSPVGADGRCGEHAAAAYAWSSCDLNGATWAVVSRKKGYYSAEVRLGRWRVGSTVTLHWGDIKSASFRSIWHAQALSGDPFAQFSQGGEWPLQLSAPPAASTEAYHFVGIKVGDPVRTPSISCDLHLPPPSPPAPPASPPPPPLCSQGVTYELITADDLAQMASSLTGKAAAAAAAATLGKAPKVVPSFAARVIFEGAWDKGGFALSLDFAGRDVRLLRAEGARIAYRHMDAVTLVASHQPPYPALNGFVLHFAGAPSGGPPCMGCQPLSDAMTQVPGCARPPSPPSLARIPS